MFQRRCLNLRPKLIKNPLNILVELPAAIRSLGQGWKAIELMLRFDYKGTLETICSIDTLPANFQLVCASDCAKKMLGLK